MFGSSIIENELIENGCSDLSLEDIFVTEYRDIIDDMLRKDGGFGAVKEGGDLLERVYRNGVMLKQKMLATRGSPPPFTICLNFDMFIDQHTRIFMQNEMREMVSQFTCIEQSYWMRKDESKKRNREDSDGHHELIIEKMFQVARAMAQKVEVSYVLYHDKSPINK
jgi:hypothetical protein